MDAITAVLVTLALVLLVVILFVTWGLVRVTRAAQAHTRRTKARVAEALPATTFGRRLWWLSCRATRVEELAREAVQVSAGSALAAEVTGLAADLSSGVAAVRVRLRLAGRLTGRLRAEENSRIDFMIGELEAGAEALVDLATRALQTNPRRTTDAVDAGRRVRHRANMYRLALDDLDGDADPIGAAPAQLEAPADNSGWIPDVSSREPRVSDPSRRTR